MSSPLKVIAFDIGIRNLAWCMMSYHNDKTQWEIHGWENYDLLAGSSTQDAKDSQVRVCATCGKKAPYSAGADTPTCAKHCPSTHPPLRDASGTLLKTIPPLAILRTILNPAPKKATRAGLLEALRAKFSMPVEKPKVTKALTEDFIRLHTSIQNFVEGNRALFQGATHILLENQPAFKNPTMKSVQILLFATLRERLVTPWVGFVHAGKKVQGKEAGDKGYNARKKGSEDRVAELFAKEAVFEKELWQEHLRKNQKKSDLCDALCMCLDRLRQESI
jgi:hypothetical protein